MTVQKCDWHKCIDSTMKIVGPLVVALGIFFGFQQLKLGQEHDWHKLVFEKRREVSARIAEHAGRIIYAKQAKECKSDIDALHSLDGPACIISDPEIIRDLRMFLGAVQEWEKTGNRIMLWPNEQGDGFSLEIIYKQLVFSCRKSAFQDIGLESLLKREEVNRLDIAWIEVGPIRPPPIPYDAE